MPKILKFKERLENKLAQWFYVTRDEVGENLVRVLSRNKNKIKNKHFSTYYDVLNV